MVYSGIIFISNFEGKKTSKFKGSSTQKACLRHKYTFIKKGK